MDTAQLYRDIVLGHNRQPRHATLPERISHRAVGDNPLCGDVLELGLDVRDARIAQIGYAAEVSALTLAACSILACLVDQLPVLQARTLAQAALDLFTANPQRQARPELGDLNALLGVLDYPNRIKTVTLPIATLLAALDGQGTASTDLNPRGAALQ
jgi:nitrogen fixation NifU-like protein